jgi:hypothetical protein
MRAIFEAIVLGTLFYVLYIFLAMVAIINGG